MWKTRTEHACFMILFSEKSSYKTLTFCFVCWLMQVKSKNSNLHHAQLFALVCILQSVTDYQIAVCKIHNKFSNTDSKLTW